MPRFLSKSFFAAAGSLALITALFSLAYLQNIPYEQEDAIILGWMKAAKMSWGQLTANVLTPVSESYTVNENVNAIRVTETLFLKGIYQFFGDSIHAIAVYNAIVAALFALMVLAVTYKFTNSLAAGFLAAVFLVTTPAFGWALLEYGDYAPSDQLLLLLYLFIFIHLLDQSAKNKTHRTPFVYAGLWLLGMLTIRAKEPNMFFVPVLSWTLLLFNPSYSLLSSKNRKSLGPLAFITFLLTLPMVLVRHFGTGSKLNPALLDPFYLFFFNPYGWAPEKTPALFSLARAYPSSVVANFGFFLIWAAIAAILFLFIRKSDPKNRRIYSVPLLLIVWTLMAGGFHVMFKSLLFTRYQTWMLLPFTLLLAWVFVQIISRLSGKWKKIAAGLLIVFVSLKSADNLLHSLYIRQELEGIWAPKWIFRTDIYKDMTGRKDSNLFAVTDHWYPRTDFTRSVELYLAPEQNRNDLVSDTAFKNILQKYGKAYAASNQPLELPWKSVLLRQIDTSKLSWLSSLKNKFSHGPGKTFFLYRIET